MSVPRPLLPRPLFAMLLCAALLSAAPSASAAEAAPSLALHGGPVGATPGAAPEPPRSDAPAAWSERQGLLERVRWWISPERLAALRSLPAGAFDTRVDWAVPAGRDDGVTDAERDELRAAKHAALDALDADGASSPLGHAYRLVARVTEVWRPNRLINALIVALPAPGVPFFTQGGAAAELELVESSTGRPVAGFECRRYAGMLRFLDAFGRIGHARGALQDCAGLFLETLREGGLAQRPPAPGTEDPRALVARAD